MPSSKHSSAKSDLSANEEFWRNANINLDALSDIVAAHMHSPCQQRNTIGEGAYARVYLFILESGLHIIGRLILPVREHLKTELEVSTMVFAKKQTSIPVPRHLFCSNSDNPVGVEWIIMEYIPGQQLADCFDDLGYPQKQQTASDVAEIMHSLFSITAPLAGSLLYDKHSEKLSSLRFGDIPNNVAHSDVLSSVTTSLVENGSTKLSTRLGPINDITFLNFPHQLPPLICGPFPSERTFLEAFAYGGIPPQRRQPYETPHGSAYDMIIKIYDAIRPSYIFDPHLFHFAHGDFSSANILVDPETGHVTGLIDWEMAGFRPSWLAAVSPGWLNDDSCRFLVTDDQSEADGYGEDNTQDAELREFFRLQLSIRSEKLFQNWLDGVELRAIFYNLCNECEGNAEVWIEKYAEKQWPEERGSFPFDVQRWVRARLGVE